MCPPFGHWRAAASIVTSSPAPTAPTSRQSQQRSDVCSCATAPVGWVRLWRLCTDSQIHEQRSPVHALFTRQPRAFELCHCVVTFDTRECLSRALVLTLICHLRHHRPSAASIRSPISRDQLFTRSAARQCARAHAVRTARSSDQHRGGASSSYQGRGAPCADRSSLGLAKAALAEHQPPASIHRGAQSAAELELWPWLTLRKSASLPAGYRLVRCL